ncbi:hypothetical protein ILUMI_04757 [Ignelater luminosus]|uniref:Tubulin polyglutamylase TTLL6 n=1 Tax=Ignelater luminosus TaxID=2038154 RepID=A0A8K0D8J8_IGNLU|nr:hypothetical protein ILUMI_04757 [Ignelater luminosus]
MEENEEIITGSNKVTATESGMDKVLKKTESSNKQSHKFSAQYFTFFDKQNGIAVAVALIAVIVTLTFSFKEYAKCFIEKEELENILKVEHQSNIRKYWVYGRNVESGYLNNVFLVLNRLGFKNDPNSTDWDLLWAHDYPFRTLYSKLINLKPHQKVNKLPGSGYITNKVDLVTSGLKYIPAAFRLPKDKNKLLEYAEKNSKTKFVQKSNDHRNIFIRKTDEIDLEKEGTFVQEFVDKPLLISGYKFDIGIYTIITSVDPLRMYMYNGDALLRFCPVQYYPFNASNIDKYVVGDDYLPTWEVPGLKYFYNTLGFSMKESLNAYLRSKNKNPNIIWEQIEDSLRIVGLAKEQQIINVINRFPSKRNFFEMMRFDFVVTEDLKVYLMEANMSPNLSSAHFPPNQLLFEQVIFNLFGLVGISERATKNSVVTGSTLDQQMQVADKNIVVFPTECNSSMCRTSCVSPLCQLCRHCLSVETKMTLKQAYIEHVNKGTCKRVFPPSVKPNELEEDLEQYSAENQLQYRWFQGKCLLDSSWCI